MMRVCWTQRETYSQGSGGFPLTFREGEFQVEGVAVKLFKVLFDTGALHKSFICVDHNLV